jgi:DNA-binding NarL/FixJ family response regulator
MSGLQSTNIELHSQATLLTQREKAILCLLAQGLSNSAIARLLYISRDTVKVNLKQLYRKLAVVNRTQAVVVAMREGFLP